MLQKTASADFRLTALTRLKLAQGNNQKRGAAYAAYLIQRRYT
jgi:hypothetical protein